MPHRQSSSITRGVDPKTPLTPPVLLSRGFQMRDHFIDGVSNFALGSQPTTSRASVMSATQR